MRNIDTHAHFFPERFIELVAKHGGRCGTTVTSDATGARFIQVGLNLRTGPITSGFIDLGDPSPYGMSADDCIRHLGIFEDPYGFPQAFIDFFHSSLHPSP
jgi:hypothetical protein